MTLKDVFDCKTRRPRAAALGRRAARRPGVRAARAHDAAVARAAAEGGGEPAELAPPRRGVQKRCGALAT